MSRCGMWRRLRDPGVGKTRRVYGVDGWSAQLEIVRAEAGAQDISNVEYRVADIADPPNLHMIASYKN